MSIFARAFLAILSWIPLHVHAEDTPFMSPGKDEISFLEKCKELTSSCFYSRTLLKDDNMTIRVSLNIISPDDIRLEDGTDRHSFSLPYLCDRTRVLGISASIYSPLDGQTRPIPISVGDPEPFVCYHEIDRSTVTSASHKRELLIARQVTETSPLGDGVLGTFHMEAGTINRHIITAAEGIPIYLDSPKMMDGSIHRGRINGSTILDEDRRWSGESSYTFYSTIESWSQFAKGYERHQNALLTSQNARKSNVALTDIDEIAAELRRKIQYRVTADNAGIYPRNSPDQITKIGIADCKDYVTLLRSALDARGIPSTSIITSLKSSPPRSLVVPDPLWADHVIVYVPEFDAYFDLAAEGDSLVNQTSAVYGKLGFRTDTGDPVIIR